MTPEKIELVPSSFAKVAPIAPQAADIFYTKLFAAAPGVRPLFPDDMKEQKMKLMTMLGVAVNGLTRLDEIVPAVQALGRRHTNYGALEEHYPVVGAALLATLEEGLGDVWTSDHAEAWGEAYALLSGVMIDAAKEAAGVWPGG